MAGDEGLSAIAGVVIARELGGITRATRNFPLSSRPLSIVLLAALLSVSELGAQTGSRGRERVVFMGNSIFEIWEPHFRRMFPGRNYIGRGNSGHTTSQMLVRFRRDVIDLKPQVVVILGGTNDVAGNGGPVTLESIEKNIVSMVQMARSNGVRVVLASILPAEQYFWRKSVRPADTIVTLNARLKAHAQREGIVYLDYHSAMKDERNGLRRELGYDGVHPNRAGFLVMAPLTETAIREALRQPDPRRRQRRSDSLLGIGPGEQFRRD